MLELPFSKYDSFYFIIKMYICVSLISFLWLIFYVQGSLEDEASLVEAVKLVDVVICAVSAKQTLQQKLLIRVIKQLGSIKVIHSIHC